MRSRRDGSGRDSDTSVSALPELPNADSVLCAAVLPCVVLCSSPPALLTWKKSTREQPFG